MHASLMIVKTLSVACSSFLTPVLTEFSSTGLSICDNQQLLRYTKLVLKY